MNFTSVEKYFYQRQKELCVNNIFDISSCESADRALSTMQRRDMTKVGKKGMEKRWDAGSSGSAVVVALLCSRDEEGNGGRGMGERRVGGDG